MTSVTFPRALSDRMGIRSASEARRLACEHPTNETHRVTGRGSTAKSLLMDSTNPVSTVPVAGSGLVGSFGPGSGEGSAFSFQT